MEICVFKEPVYCISTLYLSAQAKGTDPAFLNMLPNSLRQRLSYGVLTNQILY